MKFKHVLGLMTLLFIICFQFSTIESLSIKHDALEQNKVYSYQLSLVTTNGPLRLEMTPLLSASQKEGVIIELDAPLQKIILSPNSNVAYFISKGSHQLASINLSTGQMKQPIVLENQPQNLTFSGDAKVLYVTYEHLKVITPVDLENEKVLPSIQIPHIPQGLAISPDGTKAYITHPQSNKISILHLKTRTIDSSILAEEPLHHIVIVPDGTTAYTTSASRNAIIPLALDATLSYPPILLEHAPESIVMTVDGKIAYVLTDQSDEMIPLDLINKTAQSPLKVTSHLNHIAILPRQSIDASFTIDPAPAGFASSFDASSSKPLLGSLPHFTWDFGDGCQETTEHPIVTHVYESPASFQATLTLTDVSPISSLQATASCSFEIDENSSDVTSYTTDPDTIPTTTHLSSSSTSSVVDQPFTLTVTVHPSDATGSVVFTDGNTILGTTSLNSSGQATLTLSKLAVGTHPITAHYLGQKGSFVSSTSSPIAQTIKQGDTTTTLESFPNPPEFIETVTFIAHVEAHSCCTEMPTGTITWVDQLTSTKLGITPVNQNGQAVLSIPNFSMNNNQIIANYSGDANFISSSSKKLTFDSLVAQAPTTTTTAPATTTTTTASTTTTTSILTSSTTSGTTTSTIPSNTTTTLSSSTNPSLFCQSVTFTATVTPSFAQGIVKFFDGTTEIGMSLLNSSGIATLTTSNLSTGSHSITGVYQGDMVLQASTSQIVNQIVNKNATTTGLVSLVNPAELCQQVTFVASVQANPPCASRPTGTVTFLDGKKTIGTATLNSNGVATLIVSHLKVGNHQITASYGGDANFLSSTSLLSQIITLPPIAPPRHLRGVQIKNEFLTQTDIINVLTWQPPASSCLEPVAYRIYRNSHLTQFVAEISASDQLKFRDHNRKKDHFYTYFIVSVDKFDQISTPAKITIKPQE